MAIVLKTISDSSQAQADLAKLRDSVNGIQTSVDKVSNTFSKFLQIASLGLGGYAAFQSFAKYSDEITNLETKLRLATNSQLEFAFALDSVRNIANSTRSDLQSVAGLYSRLSRAGKDFGAAQGDIAKATDLISKAMATSGSGAQEANAAIIQLGQALSSGRLAGDELRSILENAPPLAEAIAKGLGVSIGKLRQLGEEGKLSSVRVFKAILKQQDEIEKNFAKVNITFGAAFQNLGNSLVILFDEVKKASLGSTGSFAESINNLANSIFKFATNLGFTLAVAKLKLVLFVTDSVLLFNDLWDSLKETGTRIEEVSRTLYDNWKPTLVRLIDDIAKWAVFVSATASRAATDLYRAFEATRIGQIIINNTKAFISTIQQFIRNAFQTISNNIPKIDVRSIFPGLDSALNYVRGWAISIERWFFWLYDKVVGRSWVPDLVEKVGEWFKKLNDKPLTSIKDFSDKTNSIFKNLNIAAAFLGALLAVTGFSLKLIVVLGLLTAIGIAFGAFDGALEKLKSLRSSKIEIQSEDAPTKQSKLEELSQKSVEGLQKVRKQIKDSFDTSLFGRSIKQLLGISDTTPGQIFGLQIDTKAQVGRGPYRNSEDRPFGHDFINMLPPNWQGPMVAAFTGVFVLAIVKTFEAGIVRSVLISFVTTLGAIFAAKTIDDKTLSNTFARVAFTFVDIVEKGITGLFSGSVLNDPLGVLSTIAKTALLFQAGREAIGKAAIAIATAPTKAAETVTAALERSLLRRDIEKSNKEISKLPRNLKAAVNSNQNALNQTVSQLAQLRDGNGALIGQQRALAAITSRNISAFGTARSQILVTQGGREQTALQDSQQNFAQMRQRRNELTASRDESARREKLITESLRNQADSLRETARNLGTGAGGILGGLAGLQIGTEIARGMTSSPEWVRVGTALGISFAGQAVGAGIGSIIAQTFIAAVSGVGSLIARSFLLVVGGVGAILASPILLAITSFAAIITAALNWDSLKAVFVDFEKFWKDNISPLIEDNIIPLIDNFLETTKTKLIPILDDISKRLADLWSDIKNSAAGKLNKPVDLPIVGEVSTAQAGSGLAAGVAGIYAAFKTGLLDNVINPIRTFITSNLAGFSMQFDLIRQTITSSIANLRTTLSAAGPVGQLGATVTALFIAALGLPAVKATIVAGVTLLVYKFLTSLADLLTEEVKTNKPSGSVIDQIPGQTSPQRKAQGGWISGPGTSTSDSIPALLSNGEFVVNARDAKKNWDILTAINSGMSVSRFAEGTQKTQKTTTIMESAEDLASRFANKLREVLGFNKAKETTTISTNSLKTIQDLLQSTNGLDKAFTETKRSLENAGFEKVDLGAIQKLAERDPSQFRKIASAIDDANKALLNSTDKRISQFLRNENLQRANEVFKSIADNLQKSGIASAPSKFTETPAEERKKTKLTVGDDLKLIQDAFPNLAITYEELLKFPENLRRDLVKRAADTAKALDDINSIELGTLQDGIQTPKIDVNQRRREIEDNRKENERFLRDSIKGFRVPFKDFKIDFDKLGINLTEEAFNSLDEVGRDLLSSLRNAAIDQLALTKDFTQTDQVRTDATEAFGGLVRRLTKIIQDAPIISLRNFEGFKKRLEPLGITLDENIYNVLTSAEKSLLEQYASQARAYKSQISQSEIEEQTGKITPSLAEFLRLFNQGFINQAIEAAEELLRSKGKDYKSKATLAGEALASSVSESVTNGLSGLLKGEIEKPKDFFKSVLKTFTGGIVDTFVKGLLDPFMNEKGGIVTTALKGLGTSVFNAFKGGSPSVSTGSTDGADTAPAIISGATGQGPLSLLSTAFKGPIDGLGSIFTQGFSAIAAFFTPVLTFLGGILKTLLLDLSIPFATGGKVTGPGTGTSDSIMARLSNGEFVVNAASTRKFQPLLEAINSNNIKAFAAGGIVGASIISTPVMADVGSNSVDQSSVSQVVNISITGDISRQTRSEIYKMLPSIAEGVNLHNKEKGYRG